MSEVEWSGLEVAIVGMAGRFPGARSVEELWARLRAGEECITFRSDEELLAAGADPAQLADPRYVRAAALVDDIDRFDASFFGITPREAETMDPQHRFFLECAWEALENAGYDPARCPGPVGVYGGASTNTYLTQNLLRNARVEPGSLPTLFGNDGDYLTTRVSYKLDLKGPSLDVQTGCSSSLVAVHLACQALLAGECDVALAGGVSITVPHGLGYVYQDAGIYSPDGHCRAFSSKAEGTIGGGGVALVTLRRLEDALESGDSILGIIKGSAINNDGSDKVGYAAPSVEGQAAVIRQALTMAEVSPRSITYVETHGTGTSLGDPIEVAALSRAFQSGEGDAPKGYCSIGSIKTNIGHLDAAAGVTGLIKATLALRHRELPPSLNCDEPNPAIGFENTPFRVNTALTAWECEGPRRAGVSSFGIGGTNAHVILEEAPLPADAASEEHGIELVVLSARTRTALDGAAERLGAHLEAHPEHALARIAHTLQVGRHDFEHRRAILARTRGELQAALAGDSSARSLSLVQETRERSAVFLFPGQGAQHVGMLAGIYAAQPIFRSEVDRAVKILTPLLGLDLGQVIFAPESEAEHATELLRETRLTQPALFVVEHALARLWMSFGVQPAAMIGHSIGEYVAATLAGVFSLEDALALVAERGRLMQALPEGDMLAVPLRAEEIEALLSPELSIAAVNEASSCVVSGPRQAIQSFAAQLAERGIEGRTLRTSHAFHSAMMDPILDAFTERVRQVTRNEPRLPFLSNATGTWIRPEEATSPEYWARHLRGTVRFEAGVRELLQDPHRVFLEVGPGTTLTSLTRRIARGQAQREAVGGQPVDPEVITASARHANETRDDAEVLHEALASMWLARVPIDWAAQRSASSGAKEMPRRLALPTYPFERQRFWIDPDPDHGARSDAQPGKQPRVADWFYVPTWERAPASLAASLEISAAEFLVFLEEGEPTGEDLVKELRARGKGVTTVLASSSATGEPFTGADRAFHLDPSGPEGYRHLFRTLETLGRIPEVVLHLWSLADPSSNAEGGERDLQRGLASLIFIAQGVEGIEGWTHPLEILAVTRHAQSVLGTELPEPDRASLLGACQAIAQECAHIGCRNVDLDAESGPTATRLLLSEVASLSAARQGTVHGPVAHRGAHRWIGGFEAIPVNDPTPETSADKRKESGGWVLVTGGLGSIGLEVARCLAAQGTTQLVLTGRSAFPAREQWNSILATADSEDLTRRRIEVLRAMEAQGAGVFVAQVDVTDASAMAALFGDAEQRFGALRGVVHAAGADKVMARLQETSLADLMAQLSPKRAGLAVLEDVLGERELEFCIVLSSLASVLGALGMVGYVAAHHYVDAFVARHNATHGVRWTRANWDNWLSWKEREFLHGGGPAAYVMSAEEGADAFRRVLRLPAGSEVVVSTGSLAARMAEWLGGEAQRNVAASAELHERPELRSDYVAPATPEEEAVACAWGEVLGIANIGAQDSFFELGGDSVLGLQIVAKLAQAGLKITPAQIFEHPTIAGLASVAVSRARSTTDQGNVEGPVPLTPVQHWFFEQDVPNPEHFNLPMLFDVPELASDSEIARALEDVVRQHDALRLRFRRNAAGEIEQSHAPATPTALQVELSAVDLAGVPEEQRAALMRDEADRRHVTLDLAAGPLARAIVFRMGAGQPAQLLWILHHLLVDIVSWRILIEDFRTALEARRAGKAPVLPAKSTSFQRWSQAQTEAAQTSDPTPWLELGKLSVPSLPLDLEQGPNLFSSAATLSVALDEKATRSLLQEVPPVYETQIDEVLMTALVRAFATWTGSSDLLVDLEGHGREDLGQDLDVSRTVGWFTTIFPARLTLPRDAGPGESLKAIKECARAVTRRGISFGMNRYLERDPDLLRAMSELPRPEVNFLYLGQFDTLSQSMSVRLLKDASGAPCSPDLERGHLLEIVGYVMDGRLELDWSYGTGRHRAETVERLAQSFLTELQTLIEHCLSPEAGGRTPSDFPGARVSQANLDKLLSKIGRSAKKPRG